MKPRQTTANHGKPPPTRPKNPAAVALGKLARGKRKTLTPAALAQRRAAGDNAAASFARKRLNKATIEAAQAAARDEATFSAPPPEWDDEEE